MVGRYFNWLVLLLLLLTLPACTSGQRDDLDPNTTDSVDVSAVDETEPKYQWPLVRPEGLPETLEALNSEIQWEDQPVIDALALLRELEEAEPVLATVDEALKLRNNSEEENAKILSILGRLPPPDNAGVDEDAAIIRHTRADVKSTNPIMISSTSEFEVNGLTGVGFFGFDWEMNPFASKDLVVSWQASEDKMYDKIVMRDDLTWSDGTPITAHDVVFSYQTIMNPKIPIPAVRSGTSEIRWVEAYDDYTILYVHRDALATNVWNVNFPILPKHIYENSLKDDITMQDSEYHVRYENDPVVGGPYQIVSRTRGQEIVLERREAYYMHDGKQVRDKPYFKKIRFRIIEDSNTALLAVKSGNIEELELTPEQWRTQTNDDDFYKDNTKVTGRAWTFFYFGWNEDPQTAPFFCDARVRQAMGYAFDHQEMLETLCYGLYEPCAGIFHPTAWMAPEPALVPYTQDLDRAEDLLDEAGWTDHDGDGIRDKEINGRLVPFQFKIITSNVPLRVAICNLLRESLDRIGVVCDVSPLEFTVWQDAMLNKRLQACFGGWGTGADPDTSVNIWGTGEARNSINYSNPEVDRLFQEAKREFDREKRGEMYAEIDRLIFEDQPYTFLYHQSSFYAFNKDLRGYMFSPRGPYSYSPGFSSIWRAK